MLTAISRYGARVLPDTEEIVAQIRARGAFIQGPQIDEFERAFEQRAGRGTAISAAYGRIAFYYILKALDLPAGSEIIFPSLTFWVVPELARVAGLTVVFADVDPATFNMDPASVERLITDKTRAIVPTHLYGLPCDMDRLLDIAARHNLVVIEDCAHALGATYKGRPVGTFGTGALFSFQTLKPLNCYGGGMALVQDAGVASKVRAIVDALPWPSEKRVRDRLLMGRLQRIFIKPWVFSISLFPVLWVSALIDANPDVFLWETIRSLHPLPDQYTERFPNVQAAIGLAALTHLDEWTAQVQVNARRVDGVLGGLPGIQVPRVPPDRTHVYYQYCVYGPDGRARDDLVVRCVRRGIDVETLHVDVPPDMELFHGATAEADGARRAAQAMQIPIYAGLTREQVDRVATTVRNVLAA
ncbi:MAG TPA: aminotransferase class I/II-fold pyridoxal phosphate-dependent enzyme [Vicinamibacterales bacterium]|jgi:dTDP-4-amino-4,6-dideoxygalactose transaminase|nr:aminotransferase class I/II-fold pyridoxal phosphate-dependent enzyme [Vicinamibacterales bacterium]